MKVWNIVTGECVGWNTVTGECVAALEGHGGDGGGVMALAKLDGGLLASAWYDELHCGMKVWDVGSGECVATFEEGDYDGKGVESLVALGRGLLAGGTWDGHVKVWMPTTKVGVV